MLIGSDGSKLALAAVEPAGGFRVPGSRTPPRARADRADMRQVAWRKPCSLTAAIHLSEHKYCFYGLLTDVYAWDLMAVAMLMP